MKITEEEQDKRIKELYINLLEKFNETDLGKGKYTHREAMTALTLFFCTVSMDLMQGKILDQEVIKNIDNLFKQLRKNN